MVLDLVSDVGVSWVVVGWVVFVVVVGWWVV